MYRVTREFEFCYGHRLLHHKGKCRHVHGHTGRAVITLESTELDALGMVVDFGDIRATICKWLEDTLDHNLLLAKDDPLLPLLEKQGERVYVMDSNPTAENIARLIFEQAERMNLPVAEVALWETGSCLASYRRKL
jgi:6-pyruvoyltetrahydropterin/6-carboxytetrahydropterin synthase